MANQFWYEMDKKGVAEILKSDTVVSMLSDIASSKAATANTLYKSHGKKGEGYTSKTKDLTFTSIGVVYPTHQGGVADNDRYQTLNSLNH